MENNLLKTDIECILSELETIANMFSEGTKEKIAVEIAAFAILFIYQESVLEKFKQYLKRCKEPLSDNQCNHLKNMGYL